MACVASVLVWQGANGWRDKKLCPRPNYMYTLLSLRSALQRRLSTEHLAKGERAIPHYRPKIALFFTNNCCCCCCFFTLFPALFGKISALCSIFVFRTLPDALYPLHVVFDILVNECQFTFIFYEQEFPEKQALFGG